MKKILILFATIFFITVAQTTTAYTPQISTSDYVPGNHRKSVTYTYLFPVVTKNCGSYLFQHNPARYFYIDSTSLVMNLDKKDIFCEGLHTYSIYSKKIYISVVWIGVFLLGILYFVIKYGFLKRK